MNFIKGQEEAIEKKINELNIQLLAYIKAIEGATSWYIGDGFTDIIDSGTQNRIYQIEIEIAELKNLLRNITIVEDYSSDTIQIGMTFSCIMIFDNEAVEETYTLVETKEGLRGNYISIASPFGKGVIGKRPNDLIEYEIDGNIIRGMITEVANIISCDMEESEDIRNAKNYLKFLLLQKCSLSNLSEVKEQTLNMEIDKYFTILSKKDNQKVKK